jgi:hypothetical protein
MSIHRNIFGEELSADLLGFQSVLLNETLQLTADRKVQKLSSKPNIAAIIII